MKHSLGIYGRPLKVYKIRTMKRDMYLSLDINSLDSLGKPIFDDYRITKVGKFLRRYGLDELPQIINLLCFNMKLIGIRPMRKEAHELLPRDIQYKILLQRPSLIAINYGFECTDNFDDRVCNMRQYLKEYDMNPIKTNWKYFFMVLYRVICCGMRSK